MMRQRLSRMEKLLDDLLLYSRVGRFDTQLKDVDVRELVRQIYDTYLPATDFDLIVDISLPAVRLCEAPLEQVLRNLISNAAKHHDLKKGTIQVAACQLTSHLAEFAVIDDGPGIPEQFHQRICQMFQTLRPRDEVEGSGMGLAKEKKIVEAAGGKIHVSSNAPLDRGTAFIFTWPIEIVTG